MIMRQIRGDDLHQQQTKRKVDANKGNFIKTIEITKIVEKICG